ncbi:type I restriction enzyme HsdR N-terminal domain-containing protein [Candidatus Karelsulcia muelleri]|uniref:type I restriction enzyme HsdR N-terminal domain-containing protein n=2 Tax=Candidatus Karelsulcia muelleri TaxID=336810 RepID=UPI002167BAF5|nr:type I restriction enzyme HsdR N-terminal domain-containing protein [Candidatus Karelsulcia muelleri]
MKMKYNFEYKYHNNNTYIYCLIRQKYYILTKEEYVRQHMLYYLIYNKGYNISSIFVEKYFTINNVKTRIDIIVYKNKKPYLLIECKSSCIFSQKVLSQILRYNFYIKTNFLIITNWINNLIFKIDRKNKIIIFLNEIPK